MVTQRWVYNKQTKRVLAWTKLLAASADCIECDENGKPLLQGKKFSQDKLAEQLVEIDAELAECKRELCDALDKLAAYEAQFGPLEVAAPAPVPPPVDRVDEIIGRETVVFKMVMEQNTLATLRSKAPAVGIQNANKMVKADLAKEYVRACDAFGIDPLASDNTAVSDLTQDNVE